MATSYDNNDSNSQPQSEERNVALTLRPDALAIGRSPSVVLAEAQKAAKALKKIIEAKDKKISFNGKTYLQFEDWQTLGRFYGVTAVARSTRYVEYGDSDDKTHGFEAVADALLVGSNQIISSAEAMCLDDEPNWSRKPLFQLKSMAQTRACAKVLRNVLAWVVVLAGYAPTPAEEMEQENGGNYGIRSPRRTSDITLAMSQQQQLFALAQQHGRQPAFVMQVIARHGFAQPSQVPVAMFDAICTEVAA